MNIIRFFLFCTLTLCCCTGLVQGQEISGVWTGNYSKSLLMTRPQKLVVELFLHNDSIITGASHLYYSNNKYEHYTLVGFYRKADSTVYFREDSTLGVDLGFMASNCLGNYTTKFIVTDTSLQLKGKWRDNNNSGLFRCPTMGVLLQRPLSKPKVAAPAPVTVKQVVPEPEKEKNLARAPAIQSLIEIPLAEKDSIKIELLDNKQIDGDIISLYVDDNTVLHKQLLTATPLTLYLSLKPGEPVCKIKMAAESMGSDPPCTALMRITTSRGQKYQVDLSSTYEQNAIIELFLKE